MPNPVMRMRISADAASEPVSLADAKSFCRVDISEDDGLIASLIKAARRRIENDTGLAILTQSFVGVLDHWPDQNASGLSGPWWDGTRDGPLSIFSQTGVIEIPKRPFQAVQSLQLRDAYGNYTTVPKSVYFTEVSAMGGRILRAFGQSWPNVLLAPSSAIEIAFTAGFDGAPNLGVPDELLHAVKILVKHWYDDREGVMEGRVSATPHHYADIVKGWRGLRLR